MAAIFRRVSFAGARIVTLSEGDVGILHTGLKGTMAQLYREDLADKTRRGQTGRVLAGFNPGGCAYGYRRVARLDAQGEPVRGLREIDPDEAAIVRRIFAEFVDGRSPRDIARRLNAEAIPGPSGGPWSAASINGDRVRGNGILQNDLYRGELVFNRTRRTQDPETRKKRIKVRPREEWVARPAPELRIVSDDLWEAVSARRARFDGTRSEQQRRPKRLLSGLVNCGCCGGSYVVIGAEKWGCGNRRQRGSCSNGRTIQTHLLERRVLAGLQETLLDPELVAIYVREYHRAAQERAGDEARERRTLEKRRDRAAGRRAPGPRSHSGRIGVRGDPRRAGPRPGRAAGDRGRARDVGRELGDRAAPGHRRRLSPQRRGPAGAAQRRPEDEQYDARQRLRSLIEKVVVSPAEGRPGTAISLEGRLAALLDLAAGRAATQDHVCQRWCPGGDSNVDIRGLNRGRC
jgi:site-specific DNA recombinase